MHEPCLATEPTLVREAKCGDRTVRVSVWYGVNSGPESTGFDVIRDVGLDPRVRGFPVIKAEVDSSGFGYANLLGWIQGVAHLGPDGSVEDWNPDWIPAFRDRGIPFCSLAYHPTFFDAPFWPERPRIHWRADLFLCPMVVRRPSEEEITPLVGFRWGYTIAGAGADPVLLPLESTGPEAWSEVLPRLRFWFPSWRFGAWPP